MSAPNRLQTTAREAWAKNGEQDATDWSLLHYTATTAPDQRENPFLDLIAAWEAYGHGFKVRNPGWDSIGDDGYSGPLFEDIGRALIGLLSADHGPRLSGGTLDRAIRAILRDNGCADEW